MVRRVAFPSWIRSILRGGTDAHEGWSCWLNRPVAGRIRVDSCLQVLWTAAAAVALQICAADDSLPDSWSFGSVELPEKTSGDEPLIEGRVPLWNVKAFEPLRPSLGVAINTSYDRLPHSWDLSRRVVACGHAVCRPTRCRSAPCTGMHPV